VIGRGIRLAGQARSVFLVATFLIASVPAQAQEGVPLDHLRAPLSPAFVLLGVAPSNIERPTSPKALSTSLLSAASEGDVLPKNYALEVAPYWLTAHPRLTFDDYYHPSLGQALLQTLSLSAATSFLAQEADTVGTTVGLGLRTIPFAGRANPALDSVVAELRKIHAAINDLPDDPSSDAQFDRLSDSAKVIAKKVEQLDTQRVGWLLELAGAWTVDFPGNNVDSSATAQAGAWITFGYRMPSDNLEFLAVVRYIYDDRLRMGLNRVDYGGRFIWRVNDFGISAEFLEQSGDTAPGVGSGYRLVVNAEIRVGDTSFVTASIGRDDSLSLTGSNLVALIGVNLGFGSTPSLALPGG